MRAAEEERREAHVAADEEDAGALRGVHLVAGDGEQVDVLERAVGEIERELAGGLDGVGVEERAGAWAMAASSAMGWMTPVSLLASMMLTSLVLRAQGGLRAAGSMRPEGVQGRKVTSTPRSREGLGGVEHGVVLDGGGDEVGGFLESGRVAGRRRGRGCRSRCRRR